VLYSFNGNPDGASPLAGLISDASGALYGTTLWGGPYVNIATGNGYGTVFKLTPPVAAGQPWTETVLYAFTGSSGDSGNPFGGLVSDASGALYGTTLWGGPYADEVHFIPGYGTVFKLTPPVAAGQPWTETVLYASFTGNSDGSPASTLIFDASGALYGTTASALFKLTPVAKPNARWRSSARRAPWSRR
jgi:hypothetical protein